MTPEMMQSVKRLRAEYADIFDRYAGDPYAFYEMVKETVLAGIRDGDFTDAGPNNRFREKEYAEAHAKELAAEAERKSRQNKAAKARLDADPERKARAEARAEAKVRQRSDLPVYDADSRPDYLADLTDLGQMLNIPANRLRGLISSGKLRMPVRAVQVCRMNRPRGTSYKVALYDKAEATRAVVFWREGYTR